MQLRKTLIAALGLAVAFAFAPIAPQAAPGLGAEIGSTSLIEQVAAKKKAKGKKAKAKKAKAKKGKSKASKAGRCGTGKYWSRSKRGCQDAALGPAKK